MTTDDFQSRINDPILSHLEIRCLHPDCGVISHIDKHPVRGWTRTTCPSCRRTGIKTKVITPSMIRVGIDNYNMAKRKIAAANLAADIRSLRKQLEWVNKAIEEEQA